MRRAAFAFIFFTVLLDMLALGLVAPVLPELVIALRGGDQAGAAATYGLFGGGALPAGDHPAHDGDDCGGTVGEHDERRNG